MPVFFFLRVFIHCEVLAYYKDCYSLKKGVAFLNEVPVSANVCSGLYNLEAIFQEGIISNVELCEYDS